MAYIKITTDGRWSQHEGVPDYDTLRESVGGYIEPVYMVREGESAVMWLHEEGKLEGLPGNPIADSIAHEYSDLMPGDVIVGNVVLTGDADDEGDTMGLPDRWLEHLRLRLADMSMARRAVVHADERRDPPMDLVGHPVE